MFATLVVCAQAMCPLSVGLLMISVMCYMPICVIMSLIGTYPRPIYLVSLSMPTVGKLGLSPNVFLAALLRI